MSVLKWTSVCQCEVCLPCWAMGLCLCICVVESVCVQGQGVLRGEQGGKHLRLHACALAAV